jgi:lambda family phage portal protein
MAKLRLPQFVASIMSLGDAPAVSAEPSPAPTVATVEPATQAQAITTYLRDSNLYEAAQVSRLRTNIKYFANDSKNDLTYWSRTKLLNAARYLYANDGFTRGALRDMARYSFGHTGLSPQSLVSDQAIAKSYEDYWWEWCKVCDVTGKHHFSELQKILSVSMDKDGDVGLVMVRMPGEGPRIQVIEAHRIDSGPIVNDKAWVDGVKLTPYGRPEAYRIIEGDFPVWAHWGGATRDIPATDFIHLFEGERADQPRGITALYHAINNLHDKKDLIDFEKVKAKNASAIAATLETEDGTADIDDWNESEGGNANSPTEIDLALMRAGKVQVLKKGEKLNMDSPNIPSATFQGFLEFLIRDVAAGLGLPYEFIWNPEKVGGSANRFILEKAQRRFAERQELFIDRMMNRLWFWVIADGIQSGRLKAPPAGESESAVEWQRPTQITVDAGRESREEREDIAFGTMTESESYARRGLSWREARVQKEAEADDLLTRATALAEKHKVPVDVAINLLQRQSQNPPPIDPNAGKPAPAKSTPQK